MGGGNGAGHQSAPYEAVTERSGTEDDGKRNKDKRTEAMRELLIDILPLAMGASCMYDDHPDADPTVHCCEWGPVVDRICKVLGRERPEDDVERHERLQRERLQQEAKRP